MIDGRTKLIGLIGKEVGHSLSPLLHNRALQRLGINAVYLAFELAEEDLDGFIRLLPRIGGIGLNVTTPHKAAVARLVAPGEDEVVHTGAVNTIVYRSGKPVGYATDGRGFRSWMETERIPAGEGGLVLLGFGPANRSIAYQMGREFPLTVVSRSAAEAEATLQSWYASGWPGLPARALSWGDSAPAIPSLVVGGLPPAFARSAVVAEWLAGLDPTSWLVDINYGEGRTPLHDQARDRGFTARDGQGLLLHQATISLSLWLGKSLDPSLLRDGE